MTIAIVIGFCILILSSPSCSRASRAIRERGGQKVLGLGGRGASKAPGPVGRSPASRSTVAEGGLQERQHRPQGPLKMPLWGTLAEGEVRR